MAWIEARKRGDGGPSYKVQWRLGGARNGPRQTETFGAGTDEQNRARAEGFVKMVAAAGDDWPDGWVKGQVVLSRRARAFTLLHSALAHPPVLRPDTWSHQPRRRWAPT